MMRRQGLSFLQQLRRSSGSTAQFAKKYADVVAIEKVLASGTGNVALTKHPVFGSKVAVLEIDNNNKMNGLSGNMMISLNKHLRLLQEVNADDPNQHQLVLLRGRNGVFCSGGDLDFIQQMSTMGSEAGFVMSTYMHDTLSRMSSLGVPSIAVIEGLALGGGAELTTGCDIRAMHVDAKVGFIQARLGLTPGWGGCGPLTRLLGRSRAVEYLCAATVKGADELKKIGFVNFVYKDEEELDNYLKKFLAFRPSITRAMKQVVDLYSSEKTLAQKKTEEIEIFAQRFGDEPLKEALRRFKGKK